MCVKERERDLESKPSSYNPRAVKLKRRDTPRPAASHQSPPPFMRNQLAPSPLTHEHRCWQLPSSDRSSRRTPLPGKKLYQYLKNVNNKGVRHLEHMHFYFTKTYNSLILPPCHHCLHPSVSSLSSSLSYLNPMIHHYYSSLASTSSSLLLCHCTVLVNSQSGLMESNFLSFFTPASLQLNVLQKNAQPRRRISF